jgi:hypothetical protein
MRARQQLDFCSITGHAFWPDMPTDRSVYAEIIDYHNEGFATLARNWDRLIELQRAGTNEGKFIAFPSYEWHSLKYGDHNVYSAAPDLPLRDASDLPALRTVVSDCDGIAIPHHIGYRAGYRGINWDEYREDVSPFVEIFSLHGCSLSENSPYRMLHDMGPRDWNSTAEAGWERGFRFGIAGGTDHHAAYPGSHGDGRMGVFAKELSRESIWEAIRTAGFCRNRRSHRRPTVSQRCLDWRVCLRTWRSAFQGFGTRSQFARSSRIAAKRSCRRKILSHAGRAQSGVASLQTASHLGLGKKHGAG